MIRHILFFLCAISSPLIVLAQQYNIRSYSDPQKIGQSQVYAVLEDSRSYLWLGTQGGGLTRFNGLEFRNFTKEDGLPDNYIRSLHESADGMLWIGTDRGLCRFDGLKFRIYPDSQGNTPQVNCITSAEDGKLWAATDSGLYTLEDSLLVPFSKLAGANSTLLRSCLIDQNGLLWVAGSEGLWRIKEEQLTYFGVEEGLTSPDINALAEDRNGKLWIATAESGINIYNGLEMARFDYSNEIEEGGVANCLFQDEDGQIWIGTSQKGVFVWNAEKETTDFISVAEGLLSPSVQALAADRWGNLWIGTSGGGVSCYSGRRFLHYDLRNGLLDEHIYAIHQESPEKIWFGTARGISLLERGKLSHFHGQTGFRDVKVKALLVDASGRLWAGTEGKGLAFRDSSGFHWIRSWDGLGGDQVLDIIEDNSGHIWVATADAGITRLAPMLTDSLGYSFQFRRYAGGKGIPDTYIYQLFMDRQQRLWWAGRNKGIGFIEGDSIVVIGKEEGLIYPEVRSLTADARGNIWGGMRRGGIFRLQITEENYKFDYFGKAEGLSSDNTYLLAFDGEGDLWVGSEKGLDRLRFDPEQNIAEVRHYGRAEGFQGGETCTNSVAEDGAGGLWLGTLGGLTHYLPGTTEPNKLAPRLTITEVRLFYQPLHQTAFASFSDSWGGLKKGLSLPYHQNHIGFSFIGINYRNPEAVLYQWMLEGAEEEWSPLLKERTASFSNLPPGRYSFLLRAYNENGVVNQVPLRQSFEIRPPFWQYWWFRIAMAALLLLLTGSLIRSRINRIKQQAKREREQLEMEKHLLELEQKALQLQMNPHFIFNALNSIQGLISRENHQSARYQLAKFSKLMRATLENSRSPVITLEQEIETLKNYLALEQFSRGQRFDFEIMVAEELETEALLIPPMLIQPFVENAIKHGLAEEVENAKILLCFSMKSNQLECLIEDNGIGRERAKELKSQQEVQQKSLALEVTQERLGLLGTQWSLEIIDLRGEERGTRVVMRLPLRYE